MKYFLSLALCLMLFACSSGFVENRETRSTIYEGQTTWDLYENFGAPDYAVQVAPNEIHFIFRREAVTRDWTRMYFDWCDMVVSVIDDRVVDWNVSGNQCHVNISDPEEVPNFEDNPRENKLLITQEKVRGNDAADDSDTLF